MGVVTQLPLATTSACLNLTTKKMVSKSLLIKAAITTIADTYI